MAPTNNKDRLRDYRVRLPPRPKRPMNPYTLFVKDYWAKNRSKLDGKKKGAPPSIMHALKEWKQMDSITRKTYGIEAMKDQDRFVKEMKEWRSNREFLKRPANPYIIFLKEKWASSQKKGNNRKAFGSLSKKISKEWFKLSGPKYSKYLKLYIDNMREYYNKLEEFAKGNIVDDEENFEDDCFDPHWPSDNSNSDDKKSGNSYKSDVIVASKPSDEENSLGYSKLQMDKKAKGDDFYF